MRNYSSRIKDIDSAIREVEKGNLAVRIPEFKQKDELSTIANSFNSMLDELNSYIDRFYVLNIKQQQAELKALQSQINPHFLFNTLEVIRMAAVIEGSKTSSKMIYHLSRLFRYTLDSKETVPLYIELDHTNQYLQLMQLHHPNKLDIIVDIPKDIENIPIQKLILQPVIENYMIHGFRKDQTDNHLEIRVSRVEEKIEITVKDNGIGISKARLKEIMDHLDDKGDVIQSIGLKNVHQRLRLKYGTDYGLSIQSMEGIETIITISIPIGGNSHV
nr:sensor histidine kinase [Lederbergia lenta]